MTEDACAFERPMFMIHVVCFLCVGVCNNLLYKDLTTVFYSGSPRLSFLVPKNNEPTGYRAERVRMMLENMDEYHVIVLRCQYVSFYQAKHE